MEGTKMPKSVTADQVVGAARELGTDEFSRDELGDKLGVERPELKPGFKAARQAGRLEKVRKDADGTGRFRLTGQ
jgi:hypothetical protein